MLLDNYDNIICNLMILMIILFLSVGQCYTSFIDSHYTTCCFVYVIYLQLVFFNNALLVLSPVD